MLHTFKFLLTILSVPKGQQQQICAIVSESSKRAFKKYSKKEEKNILKIAMCAPN